MSGYNERQLHRWFDSYLEDYPQWVVQRREKANLLIDGTWFPNRLCLVVYRDDTVKRTIFYRLTDNEWESQIREDLTNLQAVGIIVDSVTSDGGSGIIKAVKKACPDAVRQRCLAHIQRECLLWITKNPQSRAGKELRNLVRLISTIATHNDRLVCLIYGVNDTRRTWMRRPSNRNLMPSGIRTVCCDGHTSI